MPQAELENEKSGEVLLIDDDSIVLDCLVEALDECCNLRAATDVKIAFDLIESGYRPDLILLDIMLPDIDGYEACLKLKSLDSTRDVPIIFLSALGKYEDEIKGLESGAVDYILKPFSAAIVRTRVKTHLELKRHRDNLNKMVAAKTEELLSAYMEIKDIHCQMLQQEKMASLGQLAAGVAHEINNPIGYVSSNFSSLEKYTRRIREWADFINQLVPELNNSAIAARIEAKNRELKLNYILEDTVDLIEESRDGIDRISTIVSNLKSFSRENDDKLKPVRLEHCIETALNIAWNEIKYKATVVKEFASLPEINAFEHQLGQVVINLLVNAAHAIENQGTISIRTRHDGNYVVMQISDTGSGIKPEHRERLFEPFFTTKKQGKGTGLGLSLCYDIIKKHQGTIVVDSTVGEGSCFTVRLPLEQSL